MNRMHKAGILIVAAAMVTGMVASRAGATMAVVDDFSADSQADYTWFAWAGGGSDTYARNGANQFQPSIPSGGAQGWLRNTGEVLNPKDVVAIELSTAWSVLDEAAGLCLSPTLVNPTASAAQFEIYHSGVDYWRLYLSQSGSFSWGSLDLTFGAPVTITLARGADVGGDAVIDWTVSGGLTGSGSYTYVGMAGAPLYFGMNGYTAGDAGYNLIWDNLSLDVPEPSALVLLALGAGLLRLRRRALGQPQGGVS